VNVSGQGAAQFVAGQVVTPEFVQSQWSSAAASSNGRVANSAWMSQPGLVIGLIPMPGSVQNAIPNAVMPQSLCTAFIEECAFLALENQYHDGTAHRSLLVQTPRRSFKLGQRLTATALDALKTFWDAHQDVAFFSTTPGRLRRWDRITTLMATTPRALHGRLPGGWAQQLTIGRSNVPTVELAEVA